MNKDLKPAKPTIRIDREFDKKIKLKMVKKGLTFQELSTKLLEKWLNDEVEVV